MSKSIPVPAVGPKPQGDPDAMIELAARCATHAGTIEGVTGAACAAAENMPFQAIAASRLRGKVRGNSWSAQRVSDALSKFSKELIAGSVDLMVELKAYEDQKEAHDKAVRHNLEVAREAGVCGTVK